MAYGDVKCTFQKGDINEMWRYISGVAASFGEDTDTFKTIMKLRESLVRYTLCHPWPPDANESYSPDCFLVKFFASEYADFYFYLGVGMASNSMEPDDIEQDIIKACLDRYKEHAAARAASLNAWKNTVIHFLEKHIGEKPTREEIRKATGATLDVIRSTINELKEDGLLVMDGRTIVSVDADAAKRLIADNADNGTMPV